MQFMTVVIMLNRRVVSCVAVSCNVGVAFCSYIIEENVCCLCLCDPSYPTSLAFEYLKTVMEEFGKQCGHRIFEAQRPYHFIEFGELVLTYVRTYVQWNTRMTNQKFWVKLFVISRDLLYQNNFP